MKVINYIKLYNYLIGTEEKGGENVSSVAAMRMIGRIRKIDPSIKKEVYLWINGHEPSFEINGVSYAELRDEGMKPASAFLMLDWFLREPEMAYKYMHTWRFKSPMIPLDDKKKQELRDAMKRKGLKAGGKEQNLDESDITVE